MARYGSAPPAARYDGIPGGGRFAYLFEQQAGVPVDGSDESLRNYSPFTLSFVIPRELQEMKLTTDTSTVAGQAQSVNLIGSAARGSSVVSFTTAAAAAASAQSVLPTSSTVSMLSSFVAGGQILSQKGGFVSTLADTYTAADIRLQLERMLAAEPLTLLINPAEFSIDYSKIQSYSDRGRNGYIFEAWGEEPPTISMSGSTGGFVAGRASSGVDSPSGYQEASRRDSAAWQNFAALYQFYRNNGYIYDTIRKTEAHLFAGSLAINYDQVTYKGSIDSFSFTFTSDSVHRVLFDMDFHVTSITDNAAVTGTVRPLSPTGSGTSTFLSDVAAPSSPGGDAYADTPLDLLPG